MAAHITYSGYQALHYIVLDDAAAGAELGPQYKRILATLVRGGYMRWCPTALGGLRPDGKHNRGVWKRTAAGAKELRIEQRRISENEPEFLYG
jgi:hypothetical protein